MEGIDYLTSLAQVAMRNKRLCIKALVPGAAASTDIARNTPSHSSNSSLG
jgi:hypothetical protein